MKKTALILLLTFMVASGARAQSLYTQGPGKYPEFDAFKIEKGLQFGPARGALSLPKTILYIPISAKELAAEAGKWARWGFGGFFLNFAHVQWQTNVWALDGDPATIGQNDATFRAVKTANDSSKKYGLENFFSVSFSKFLPDWFDDLAWQKITENFRQFALFARETGCTGISLDIEYIYPQYYLKWKGYVYDRHTPEELVQKVRSRMTALYEAMYREFPEMVLITLPQQKLNLGTHFITSWIEAAARHNAPGGVHLFGEYSYRRPNTRYVFEEAAVYSQQIMNHLSPEARVYFQKKGSVAEGVWMFGSDHHDPRNVKNEDFVGNTPEQFRVLYANSLMLSRRYNWIFGSDGFSDRAWRAYKGKKDLSVYRRIVREKQIIRTKKYLALAKSIRNLTGKDVSRALGLGVDYRLDGPRDDVLSRIFPLALLQKAGRERLSRKIHQLGEAEYEGHLQNFWKIFGTQKSWLLIGPFDNEKNRGFGTVFPPEKGLHLNKFYRGKERPIHWFAYADWTPRGSVDFTQIFHPKDNVCAYAAGVVQSPRKQNVQIRLGTNDACVLWVNGRRIFTNPQPGRAILDKNIVTVTLRKGANSILLKICQGGAGWGFYFRMTDAQGNPVPNLTVTLPEGN